MHYFDFLFVCLIIRFVFTGRLTSVRFIGAELQQQQNKFGLIIEITMKTKTTDLVFFFSFYLKGTDVNKTIDFMKINKKTLIFLAYIFRKIKSKNKFKD